MNGCWILDVLKYTGIVLAIPLLMIIGCLMENDN